MKIQFTLNGRQEVLHISSDVPLLQLLTEYSGISSIRPGCDRGRCGNCVVLVNDLPLLSCLVPAFDIRGRQIVTFERFSQTRDFTEIQKGFTQADALPCSFCFASKSMLTHGIISGNTSPQPEEILQAFSLNACTCLEPSRIVQGVQQAGTLRGRRRRHGRRK